VLQTRYARTRVTCGVISFSVSSRFPLIENSKLVTR
jgi:hypothetical protein